MIGYFLSDFRFNREVCAWRSTPPESAHPRRRTRRSTYSARPSALRISTMRLDRQREHDVLPHDAAWSGGRSTSPRQDGTACRPSVRRPPPRLPRRCPCAPIAMPTSARESTGASLMPSPTKATVHPPASRASSASTRLDLVARHQLGVHLVQRRAPVARFSGLSSRRR